MRFEIINFKVWPLEINEIQNQQFKEWILNNFGLTFLKFIRYRYLFFFFQLAPILESDVKEWVTIKTDLQCQGRLTHNLRSDVIFLYSILIYWLSNGVRGINIYFIKIIAYIYYHHFYYDWIFYRSWLRFLYLHVQVEQFYNKTLDFR